MSLKPLEMCAKIDHLQTPVVTSERMVMFQIVGPLKFPLLLGKSGGNSINPIVAFEPLPSPCQLTTVLAGATQVDVPINADTGAHSVGLG